VSVFFFGTSKKRKLSTWLASSGRIDVHADRRLVEKLACANAAGFLEPEDRALAQHDDVEAVRA